MSARAKPVLLEVTTFENHYTCECGCSWTDVWCCACDDRCPDCNAEIEPDDSIELEVNQLEKGVDICGCCDSTHDF